MSYCWVTLNNNDTSSHRKKMHDAFMSISSRLCCIFIVLFECCRWINSHFFFSLCGREPHRNQALEDLINEALRFSPFVVKHFCRREVANASASPVRAARCGPGKGGLGSPAGTVANVYWGDKTSEKSRFLTSIQSDLQYLFCQIRSNSESFPV